MHAINTDKIGSYRKMKFKTHQKWLDKTFKLSSSIKVIYNLKLVLNLRIISV